jgi:Fe-S cluster biogenesis protein NfuA
MDGSLVAGVDLSALVDAVARIEATVETWDGDTRDTARAYRQAIDALHAEALRRLIRSLRDDPAASAGLRAAAADEIVYAVLRHHGLIKPSLAERVEAALDSVRPILAGHDGDLELVRIEPPTVAIRFAGACRSCPASALTIDSAIKTALRASCPEITEVVEVRV